MFGEKRRETTLKVAALKLNQILVTPLSKFFDYTI